MFLSQLPFYFTEIHPNHFFIANPSNFAYIVTLFKDMGVVNKYILLNSIQKNSQWLK